MSRRGVVAVAILPLGRGLALRDPRINPSPAARLAEVALRIVPAVTWYAVERDGRQVGFASISIDTVPRALQVTEYLVADGRATADTAGRLTDQVIVRLSAAWCCAT